MAATASSYNPSYRYGDSKPIVLPFKTGIAVNVGDLVYQDATDSNTVKPASSLAWATAIATPAAPTVTAGTANGTTLTAAATGVKVSYQFPWGEGALSAAGSATPVAGGTIVLAGSVLPAPAIGLNIYVESAAGSGVYKLWEQVPLLGGILGVGTLLITGYGLGQAPSGSPVTSGSLDITQYNFAQSFAGSAGQAYDGVNASAYGIQDGTLRVDTAGVHLFTCASATFTVGQWLGVAQDTGNNLYQQNVIGVVHPSLAVARVVKGGTALTSVLCELYSAKYVPAHA